MATPTIPGFEDLTEVGRGGFGTVYRAPQPGFGRDVAIKVLSGDVSQLDDKARRRFDRETETTGQLSTHPHIVTLHAAGFTDDERAYFVMAFHEGGSLRDKVNRDGPLSWREATVIGVHLAGALATAHAAGIIHRDVKPDNVLVDEFGSPVLTDFGIASVTGTDTATLTSTGQLTMTVAFSPPEVLDGARPEQRTDVFALGATLFALMVGHPPFVRPEDTSVAQVMARMVREDAPDLRDHGVPGPVAAAIARALARDPADRTPTALALGQQLQDAQRELGEPVTQMVLPASLDAGREDERTLALPGLALEGLRDTDGGDDTSPSPGPPGAAETPTADLRSSPATTPTDRLPGDGHHAQASGPGPDRTPTEAFSGQQAWPSQTPQPSPGPPLQPPRRRSRGIGSAVVGGLVGLAVLAVAAVVVLVLQDRAEQAAVTATDSPTPTDEVAQATPTETRTQVGLPPGSIADPTGTGPIPTGPTTTEPTTTEPTEPTEPTAPAAPDVVVAAEGEPAEEVALTLQRWHDGINSGDYQLAFDTYTTELQQQVTFSRFRDGNQTSTILAPTVQAVSTTAEGLEATIAFRSLQDPEFGADGQDCSDWVLRWTMVPAGGGPLEWLVSDVDALDGSPQAC